MPGRPAHTRDVSTGLLRPTGLLAAALAVPALVLVAVSALAAQEDYSLHFVAVSATMAAAAAGALVLTRAGIRQGDARAVTVGAAFTAMAGLLLVHGLATPEIIVPDEEESLLAFAGGATLPVGAAVLCLVGSRRLRRPGVIRRLLVLDGLLLAGILGLGALGLADPGFFPAQPAPRSAPALVLLAVSVALFAVLGRRVWRTYVLTRRPADLSTVVGVGWLATALVASLLSGAWSIPWWLGHALETSGMLAIAVPVALDLRHRAPSRALAGDLGATELVAEEEALLGPQVRALMVRLAEKDVSTEEHTRRVARLAVEIGEQLGLSAVHLRRLAIGGLLHDIGKLQVPDEILGKPDALTEEEFAVIRLHPGWGDELAASLGFDELVRRLVRSHHERLDGNGYPDRLPAAKIGTETRILMVSDVYDALVSSRVYRSAFPREEALGIIRADAAAFDPRCVEALVTIVEGPR
jgi:putative nucleotidyltransferase with HDIG domain